MSINSPMSSKNSFSSEALENPKDTEPTSSCKDEGRKGKLISQVMKGHKQGEEVTSSKIQVWRSSYERLFSNNISCERSSASAGIRASSMQLPCNCRTLVDARARHGNLRSGKVQNSTPNRSRRTPSRVLRRPRRAPSATPRLGRG